MLRNTRLALIVSVLIAPGGGELRAQTPRAETSETAPTPAHQALASGQPERALALLQSRVLQLPPAERHSIAGRAHLALRSFHTARRELTSAVRMRPHHAGDLHALGRALLGCKAPSLAATQFARAHWRGLNSAELHHHWAVSLRDSGRALGEVSLRKIPPGKDQTPAAGSFALGGVVLGAVPRRPGAVAVSPPNSALFHACRAVQREPDRAGSLLLCGELWSLADRHAQAIAMFEKAVNGLEKDDLIRCHRKWADSLFAERRFDEYLRHARAALRVQGGLDSVLLAACYDRVAGQVALRGEPAAQVRYLKFAAELHPSPDRLIRLADALSQANDYIGAVSYLKKALDKRPTPKQRREIVQRIARTTYLASPR